LIIPLPRRRHFQAALADRLNAKEDLLEEPAIGEHL
jgi:hypothetical protein